METSNRHPTRIHCNRTVAERAAAARLQWVQRVRKQRSRRQQGGTRSSSTAGDLSSESIFLIPISGSFHPWCVLVISDAVANCEIFGVPAECACEARNPEKGHRASRH
jgi:hypothetical protein